MTSAVPAPPPSLTGPTPVPFATPRQRVAVIGAGVSGLVAARLLHEAYDVTVFEAGERIGGHVHTARFDRGGRRHAVDMGFIVFNHLTYPLFTRLLARLGVAARESEMSFSVRCERTGLEYNGTSLDALFAQRRNLLNPGFIRMTLDILRFHKRAAELLEPGDETLTIGAWSRWNGFSQRFLDQFLLPMAAALWSSDLGRADRIPARWFARFFHNHGMLTVDGRPQWLTVEGGSDTYLAPLIQPFEDRIRTGCPIRRVERTADHVEVTPIQGVPERFDFAVLATHGDQSLRMLADPTDAERAVLGAVPYTGNDVVLHTDTSILPRARKAWASWNYHLTDPPAGGATVTYLMNLLQGLDPAQPFCVTLNRQDAVAPAEVIEHARMEHPVFTGRGVLAQTRRAEIDGARRTFYAGAWWGFGFHEDGVRSAVDVCRSFRRSLECVGA